MINKKIKSRGNTLLFYFSNVLFIDSYSVFTEASFFDAYGVVFERSASDIAILKYLLCN